ncbi:SCP2 domain-containing protein [Vibrio ruber]|uniref:Ubiquinone biosynthesis accessory factor UbiT n=1 Tax=Vibrio ruber (strain DSM 16370 / JCM 11486 / BCRC 17186 / CECT 7878 / LMG 23124 / VR1) TaxID=1123498 RepID=A0A1R4LC44_VIBR1|nr:SCP2 domain-containing protein [Vibrio ruber]WNJ96103.1 SCP2 domain-containing protein [Vibrio ruber]SJN53973.1 SCP-2 sterol transfer family protein [Vibrio ruber DSM 16370]
MFNKIHSYMVQNAASFLRTPARFLPDFVQNKILLEALNTIFKEALAEGEFEFLESKCLKVEVKDLGLSWHITCRQAQLVIAGAVAEPDACFSGSLNDFVLIAGRKEDPDTLFFQRRLSIEGDTELGLEIKNMMDSVDLETFPVLIKYSLNQLSDFVYKGIQSERSNHKGTVNAYSH